MGTITLQQEIIGGQNATEDPKISSNFTVLQTLLNGNLDTNNLSPTAGITAGQLAAGAGRLATLAVAGSVTASNGQLLIVNAASATVTLPAPTVADQVIGVRAGTGVTPSAYLTVTTPSGVIVGVGVNFTSFVLGQLYATVLLQSDGTNWNIIAGRPDSGWVPLGLAANVVSAGGYTPSARLQEDVVRLKGILQNNTGGTITASSPLATLPASQTPGSTVTLSAVCPDLSGWNGPVIITGTNLEMTLGWPAGSHLYLDGLTFSRS